MVLIQWPEAVCGFANKPAEQLLEVDCPTILLQQVDISLRDSLLAVLAHDPRPQYQDDPERVYGMAFGPYEVRFKVNDLNLTVLEITKTADSI